MKTNNWLFFLIPIGLIGLSFGLDLASKSFGFIPPILVPIVFLGGFIFLGILVLLKVGVMFKDFWKEMKN